MSFLTRLKTYWPADEPQPDHGEAEKALAAQLKTFRMLDFNLNNGAAKSDLDRWGGPAAFAKDPYRLLYVTLGEIVERPPFSPICDRCWHFDPRAIRGNGSYRRILHNLARITRGDISFRRAMDLVKEDSVTVTFQMGESILGWAFRRDGVWVDMSLFAKLVGLVEKLDVKGRYTVLPLEDGTMVLGYETPEGLERLCRATGLDIGWLSEARLS